MLSNVAKLGTPWQCQQCQRPHVLTDAQEVERRGTPITTRCECGARYQITRDAVRWIERAPGYYCVLRRGCITWIAADAWQAGDVEWRRGTPTPNRYGPKEDEYAD